MAVLPLYIWAPYACLVFLEVLGVSAGNQTLVLCKSNKYPTPNPPLQPLHSVKVKLELKQCLHVIEFNY